MEQPSKYFSNRHKMSISELIFELRDTFLPKDFDIVEETLIAREAKLKAEIEEKNRQIGLLTEEVHFQKLEKLTVELELKRLKEQNGDIACGVSEKRSGTGTVNDIGENNEDEIKTTLVREATLKSAIEEKVAELEEKTQFKNWGKLNFEIEVKMIGEKKHGEEFMKVGENDKVVKEGKKDGPNASGNDFDPVEEALAVREASIRATIEDKMRKIRLLPEKMVKEENCATATLKDVKVEVLAEKKRLDGESGKKIGLASSGNWKSSSREVPKNIATKLAEPTGILKRDFASTRGIANILAAIDSDSSSSSSSSSDEFDISSLMSFKRKR